MFYIWLILLLIGGVGLWWMYKDVNRGGLIGADAFTFKYDDFIREMNHLPGTIGDKRYAGIYKIDLIEGFNKKYRLKSEDREMCTKTLQALNRWIKDDIEEKRGDRVRLMRYLIKSEKLIEELRC